MVNAIFACVSGLCLIWGLVMMIDDGGRKERERGAE